MNKRIYIFAFLICIIALPFVKISAQGITVHALMDTTKIRIGEQTKIQLFVNYKTDQKNLKIQWPQFEDTLRKEVEIVDVSKIDTTMPDKNDPNNIQQHQTITVTSFDSGYWALQPFKFIINGDTAKPMETQAFLLEVQTVPVDTAEASIKDIKAPFAEPIDWHEFLPYIYWGLGILAIIVLLIIVIVRLTRKKTKYVAPPPPAEPPHVTALRELNRIKEQRLWQEGKMKEYYTAITDALRVYIEGRYKVHAMELTTDEIMTVMKSQVIDGMSKEKLQQVLSLADYVKFAKAQPIDVENELVWNNALMFIQGTMREEVEKFES